MDTNINDNNNISQTPSKNFNIDQVANKIGNIKASNPLLDEKKRDEKIKVYEIKDERESAKNKKQGETKEFDKITNIYEQKSVNKENIRIHDINDFILQEKIGQGSFGKVYKVKFKNDGQIFAAKISINLIDEKTIKDQFNIAREVNIISKITHPSILRFIFFSFRDLKNKNKPVIITEYASNGTLEEIINGYIRVNDTQKLIITYGIASAMSFLHLHGIIHRDLKPANILLDDFLFPKISDFGLSKFKVVPESESCFQSTIGNIKGTPIYMSPEIYHNSEYSEYSDVYAFGLIIYQLYTNEKIFDGCNFFQVMVLIENSYRPKFTKKIPNAYKNLIERCWNEEANKRPIFSQIVNELRDNKEFITSTINEDIFQKYIKYLDDYNCKFDQKNDIVDFKKYFSKVQLKEKEVYIKKDMFSRVMKYFPYKEFNKLDDESKQQVENAENDTEMQFIVGQNLIECKNNFPLNRQLGIDYLKLSYKGGNLKSLNYYIRIIIKGKIIPKNHKKAKKLLDKYFDHDDPIYLLLYGLLYKYEQKYSLAKDFFFLSSFKGNPESKYQLGKMHEKGLFFEKDVNKSIEYYKESIEGGCDSAMYKYGRMLIEKGNFQEGINYIRKAAGNNHVKSAFVFAKVLRENQYFDDSFELFKRLANEGHAISNVMYASLLTNIADTQSKKEDVLSNLKKAADKGIIHSIYLYGKYLPVCSKGRSSMKETSRYIKIAADNGISDAMCVYGRLLAEGDGVEINYTEAIKYYKMAIDLENASAMYNYGVFLEKDHGINIKANPLEAIKYYKMAINKGNANAMNQYGYMLQYSNGVEVDIYNAIKYYQMAIDHGNIEAMINYSTILEHGIGVEQNVEEANRYLKMAVDKGSPDAIVQYALFMHNKLNDKTYKSKIIKYLKNAIDQGNTTAMNSFAKLLYTGDGISKNIKEAIKYYKMAADKGDENGMINYAKALYNGIGVATNKQDAIKYIKMASDKGNKEGMYLYAQKLFIGEDVTMNIEEAMKLFKSSADKGYSKAINQYAKLIFEGKKGIAVNKEEGIKYFKLAIEKNNEFSMYNYALILYKGDGVAVDKKEAFNYFKMAADRRYTEAMFYCANMLNYADGIQVNKEEALKYYKKAADNGHLKAMNEYENILFNGNNKEERILQNGC